jgi:hypothetical protein
MVHPRPHVRARSLFCDTQPQIARCRRKSRTIRRALLAERPFRPAHRFRRFESFQPRQILCVAGADQNTQRTVICWSAGKRPVLGRNPTGIRSDFRVSMEHPRERASPEFVVYVDYVYKMLTQPELEARPPSNAGHGRRTHQLVPIVRRGAIAGRLEFFRSWRLRCCWTSRNPAGAT